MSTIQEATRVQSFYSLTPDQVLGAVEKSGRFTTGLCYPLNSLENRVYEVELEDQSRVVGKFYRPGRWSKETILDEHRLLAAMAQVEIPVCPPIPFDDGTTLHQTGDDIFYALFPRTGGRAPAELSIAEYEQLGHLLGRIHNCSASLDLEHRPIIAPHTYGIDCLSAILQHATMEQAMQERYADAVKRVVDLATPRFENVETFVIHGDCHKGNLLRGSAGWFFLDFDDSASGPAAQDIWLLLPARRADSGDEIDSLLRGYERFRNFDRRTLNLIEPLRALRYVRYAAWVTTRWEDPSFKRAFPHYGTEIYWNEQIADLYEQLRVMQAEDVPQGWH